MDDLRGKYVNVVLTVEEGRDMAFLKKPVFIAANFDGRLLESDPAEADDSPVFNTELVWETEKKELRRIRSSHGSLRVELQVPGHDDKKSRIGFALLNLRSANIVLANSTIPTPFAWQKLMGVPHEYRNFRPELFLSLSIRESDDCESVSNISLQEVDAEADATQHDVEKNERKIIQPKYLSDGHVQIGEDIDCCQSFSFAIHLKSAANLDLLLPEVLVFKRNRDRYYMSFNIFGITIKSKTFSKDLHSNILLKEKLVVKILSSYGTLSEFLKTGCCVTIGFHCGQDKLGMAQLDAQNLIGGLSEEEFEEHHNCFVSTESSCCPFKFPSDHGMVPKGSDGRFPKMDIKLVLERLELHPKPSSHQSDEEQDLLVGSLMKSDEETQEDVSSLILDKQTGRGDEGPKSVNSQKEIRGIAAAGGDDRAVEIPKLDLEEIELPCKDSWRRSRSEVEISPKKISEGWAVSKSTENFVLTGVRLKTRSCSPCPVTRDKDTSSVPITHVTSEAPLPSHPEIVLPQIYLQYCVDITLETISWKKMIKGRSFCFKFKHPRAASQLNITSHLSCSTGDTAVLENVGCKVFYISTPDQVRKTIYAWPPKLSITTEAGTAVTEDLEIYTAVFLSKERNEWEYTAEMKATKTYEPIVKLAISMSLKEYGLNSYSDTNEQELLPALLDDKIAVKELQELQEWKQLEKERFLADLKEIERKQMEKLKTDWEQEKREMQVTLRKSVEKCRSLSKHLQATANQIRTRKEVERKESELSQTCNLEDEVQRNALKLVDSKHKELVEIITKLERDNLHLNSVISDLREEVQSMKQTALTKEQTANLLQQLKGLEENFEEAQKAKTYFKTQYRNAVREIHCLRSEDHRQIEDYIKVQKEQLSTMNLNEVVFGRSETFGYHGDRSRFTKSENNFDSFKWYDSDFGKPSSFSFT